MAHEVTVSIPQRKITKSDIEFLVKENDEVLGRLKVSQGAVVWVPKNAKYGYRVAWSKFADLMFEGGTRGNW